ncbi:MAG: energy transducer TonB [Acidobacteriota bacterium]
MLSTPVLAVALLLAQGFGSADQNQRQTQGRTQSRPAAAHGLASAKVLYAAASYEEALTQLSDADPADDVEQIEIYRALCQIALGRDGDAAKSLERLLDRNPFHSLSEAEVSPRLVTMFREVKTRRLPAAARDLYMQARTKYDEKSFGAAADMLRELLAGLAKEDLENQAGLADLKLLAEGFLRLTEIEIVRYGAMSPPPSPTPAPVVNTTAASSPAVDKIVATFGGVPLGATPAPVIYSSEDRYVVAPVEVSRKMPNWNPPPTVQPGVYQGLLEVVIDERGTVQDARILISVAPTYDPLVLAATRNWRFRPATLNGEPVKYRRRYEIILHPE